MVAIHQTVRYSANSSLVNECQFVQAAAIDIGEGFGAVLSADNVDIMGVAIYKHACLLAASVGFR